MCTYVFASLIVSRWLWWPIYDVTWLWWCQLC